VAKLWINTDSRIDIVFQ